MWKSKSGIHCISDSPRIFPGLQGGRLYMVTHCISDGPGKIPGPQGGNPMWQSNFGIQCVSDGLGEIPGPQGRHPYIHNVSEK